jgi:hypothetical protein
VGSRNNIWLQIVVCILFFCLSACDDQGGKQSRPNDAYRTLLEIEAPLPIDERQKILVVYNDTSQATTFQEVKKGILRGFAEEGFIPYKNLTIDFFSIQSIT